MATEPRQIIVHGRPRWQVDLRQFGAGRPVFTSKTAALTHLRSVMDDHARHGQLAFDLPADQRRRYLALDTRAVALGTTLEAALEWWVRSHRGREDKALGEAVKACLAAKRQAKRRARYLSQLEITLTDFVEHVGPAVLCSAVTVDQIEAWLASRPLAAVTRAGYASKVSALFGFALKRGWVVENPAKRLEEISVDRKPPGILTVREVRCLLESAQKTDRRLIPWFVLSLFAGLRFSEAKRLPWSAVNLRTGYVEVSTALSKTRERRLVQLQPNALAWLKLGGDLPVVNLEERFDRVRRAAGWAVKRKERGRRWPRNAMRHSFCSYCLPIFGELKESAWAGHSPQVALSHYRELVTEEAAREFWAIQPS